MMAGRNMSCSHLAFTSTRIMNTCAIAGQVAGTAAALCASRGISPKDILSSAEMLASFRQQILRDGLSVMNFKNEDPLDLARSAKITASESADGTRPENVASGVVYDFKDKNDNKWKAPIGTAPVLKLEWDSPQDISEIVLNFDTGSRMLTMTRQTNFMKKILLGAQPECLRDYRITATLADGTKKTLADEKGNYQKRVEHRFEKISAKSLEIRCLATNGSEFAAIFEVRAYA